MIIVLIIIFTSVVFSDVNSADYIIIEGLWGNDQYPMVTQVGKKECYGVNTCVFENYDRAHYCTVEGNYVLKVNSYCSKSGDKNTYVYGTADCPGTEENPCIVFVADYDKFVDSCTCKGGTWLDSAADCGAASCKGQAGGKCCGDDAGESFCGYGYSACVSGTVLDSTSENQYVCGCVGGQGNVCDTNNEAGCWAAAVGKCCGDDGTTDNFAVGLDGDCAGGVYKINADYVEANCISSAGAGRWNLPGDFSCNTAVPGTNCCCGDDPGAEYYTFLQGHASGETNKDIAWADNINIKSCCDTQTDCVDKNSNCVAFGNADSNFNPSGNDDTAVCYTDAGNEPGKWYDCDQSATACGYCAKTWAKNGEADTVPVGEYTTIKGTSECCGDDPSENMITRKGDGADSGDYACCSTGTDCVWDNECYESSGTVIYPVNGEMRMCNNGDWSGQLDLKYVWDDIPGTGDPTNCLNSKTCGYCTDNSKCFVKETGGIAECIDSGEFAADHFCEDGGWSSRTKLVALELLELATNQINTPNVEPGNYILFCDDYDKVLNYIDYTIVGPAYPVEDFLKGVMGNSNCQNSYTSEVDQCVNEMCVLIYHVNGNKKIAIGTALNQILEPGFSNYPFLSLIAPTGCTDSDVYSVQIGTYGEYRTCVSSQPKIWYNSRTQSVIYSNDAIQLNQPSFSQIFLSFLKSPFETIFSIIKKDNTGSQIPQWQFITNTKEFSKLYLLEDGVKSIKGIVEKEISQEGIGEEFMAVRYNCISSDICNSVNNYNADLGAWSSETISCESGANNEYYVKYTPQSDSDAELGFRTWIDLTAKIRMKDIGQLPIGQDITYISYPKDGAVISDPNYQDDSNTVMFVGGSGKCSSSISYEWKIMDAGNNQLPVACGSSKMCSYTFTTKGTYTITLTATESGAGSSTSISIYVDISKCGDNIKNGNDQCDGTDLGLSTDDCTELPGFVSGKITCNPDCTYDTGQCSKCGNGDIDTGEVCDTDGITENLNGDTCQTKGYENGVLHCNTGCLSFNVSGCYSCDDGIKHASEVCDMSDSGYPIPTCIELGFTGGGPVSCVGCNYDTSLCLSNVCGNGVVETGEDCDDGKQYNNGIDCTADSSLCPAECLLRDNDGCSLSCTIESGYNCQTVGGKSVCGIGTPISDCNGLKNIANNLGGSYYLINDIDCSGGFNRIGSCGQNIAPGSDFTGVLDGNGFSINNININYGPLSNVFYCVGMFGSASNAVLKDFTLVDLNVECSASATGGLIGAAWNTEIGNVHIINSLSISRVKGKTLIGGLVGIMTATSISNSHSDADVTGGNLYGIISNPLDTGGLVGYLDTGSSITQSYSTGDITGGANTAGLVGWAYYGTTVTDSYSTGDINLNYAYTVFGDYKAPAGFVGNNYGSISNCYSAGSVENLGVESRGFAASSAQLSNCYWDTTTSGQAYSAGGYTLPNTVTGLSTASMYQKNSFTGWDIKSVGESGHSVWRIDNNNGYPYLEWQDLSYGDTGENLPSEFNGNYFALSYGVYTGNLLSYAQNNLGYTGQSGLEAADKICLNEVNSHPFKGKPNEYLFTQDQVHAFLCDSAGCFDLQPYTTYTFAKLGSDSVGGATFTTDNTGRGPGYSGSWWKTVDTFGGLDIVYFTGRYDSPGTTSDTLWGDSGETHEYTCNDWSYGNYGDTPVNSAGSLGAVGLNWMNNKARWLTAIYIGDSVCGESHLICIVEE
ncbi:MAG: GLUG motif-containing protein [Nanoarchaeota archaeon]